MHTTHTDQKTPSLNTHQQFPNADSDISSPRDTQNQTLPSSTERITLLTNRGSTSTSTTNITSIANTTCTTKAEQKVSEWKAQKKERALWKKVLEERETQMKKEKEEEEKRQAEEKKQREKEMKRQLSLRNIASLKSKNNLRNQQCEEGKITLAEQRTNSHNVNQQQRSTEIEKNGDAELSKTKQISLNPLKVLNRKSKIRSKTRLERVQDYKQKLREMKVPISQELRMESHIKIDKVLNSTRYRFKNFMKASDMEIFSLNDPEALNSQLKRHSVVYLQQEKSLQKQQYQYQPTPQRSGSMQRGDCETQIYSYLQNNPRNERLDVMSKRRSDGDVMLLLERGDEVERRMKDRKRREEKGYVENFRYNKDVDAVNVNAMRAKVDAIILAEALKKS